MSKTENRKQKTENKMVIEPGLQISIIRKAFTLHKVHTIFCHMRGLVSLLNAQANLMGLGELATKS